MSSPVQVGLGGATGLGLGVGNHLAGSSLSGRGGLEGLSLGSLIGGLQQGLPASNRERMGERCMVWLVSAGCEMWGSPQIWRVYLDSHFGM